MNNYQPTISESFAWFLYEAACREYLIIVHSPFQKQRSRAYDRLHLFLDIANFLSPSKFFDFVEICKVHANQSESDVSDFERMLMKRYQAFSKT